MNVKASSPSFKLYSLGTPHQGVDTIRLCTCTSDSGCRLLVTMTGVYNDIHRPGVHHPATGEVGDKAKCRLLKLQQFTTVSGHCQFRRMCVDLSASNYTHNNLYPSTPSMDLVQKWVHKSHVVHTYVHNTQV